MHVRDPTGTAHDHRLVSIADVAEIYAVRPTTIRAWLYRRDPRLPSPIRYGQRYTRFRLVEVLERIEAMQAGVLLLPPTPK